jgi:phage-related minor tail protein
MKTSTGGSTSADSSGGGIFDLLFTLLKVVPFANGGVVSKPTFSMIGEAGPEAVMPLSKLSGMMNSTFNAGAMSGQSTGGNGQFVLRGQDLLVAINRTQKSSFLKGQNISLV